MTEVLDALVIGAGQAGLSASHHLKRLGIDHVVLDADAGPGGAWQHRWDSLTMLDVHGVADLPDAPAPGGSADRANVVIPSWFAEYEQHQRLPVIRPVRVDAVRDDPDDPALLQISSGDRVWRSRTLINATGTWSRPFIPRYPGQASFAGEQWHTADYPGRQHLAGRRVVVVGGGASAIQFLGELAPVADTIWVTRRPPVWRTEGFSPEAGLDAVTAVAERVTQGLPPASVVSVTGLALRPQEQEAARLGAYERRAMFERIEPNGIRWADGTFEKVDVILWATGFRPAVTHLAPLHLRSPLGGIALEMPAHGGPQAATTAALDARVQLVGYGPSASTIGGNRAGRAAATAVRRYLRGARDESAGLIA
ncbi:NAD(P)-binding domain-containing protein [Flexivirga meconopsidis]|uniref:NAD(P)-binding domain-containing protein n=1 Tax=Flexivirga meconopsidis TaxID=2977121 RepID=UPI00223F7864